MEQPERAGWAVAVAGWRRWRVIARVLAPGDAHLQADLRQAMVLALVEDGTPRTVRAWVRLAEWRARDWARKQRGSRV